jgi:AMP nucleosidase
MTKFDDSEYSWREEAVARDTIDRYSGSPPDDFQPYLLVTNFPRYVEYFATSRGVPIIEGSMFKVAHAPQEQISILDFKIGSPAAALLIDLCAHLPIRAALTLGMCGGLRRHYKVGDYFVPVASIRGEGTSDFYFPSEVPALANFTVQKSVTNILEQEKATFHIGITHTTNKRFWEFNNNFRNQLETTRVQAIEMECATLFMSGYYHKLPIGALLLISDLPLDSEGVKTKESSRQVFIAHTEDHVEKGVRIMHNFHEAIKIYPKGVFRGHRRRFENRQPPL